MTKKLIIIFLAIFFSGWFFNAQIFQYIPGWAVADDNFSLTVSAGPDNPLGGQVVKGTRGLTMLEAKFKVSGSDGLKISSLVFRAQKEGFQSAKKEDLKNFRLYDEKGQQLGKIGQGTDLQAGKIIFSNLGLFVPRNSTKTLTVRGDLGENTKAEKLRVVLDNYSLGLSSITGQKTNERPNMVGTVEGQYFIVTDKFVHLTEPWHGLIWQTGQTYKIGWNHRSLVDKISLVLIGYQDMDDLSPGKTFPIVRYFDVNQSSSFDSYSYTVPQSLLQDLGQYKYFKIGATFELPKGGSRVAIYESLSSGFFQIIADTIISTRVKLISLANSPKVYYITNGGLKRHILNVEVFDSYGDKWSEVVEKSIAEFNAYEDSDLIYREGDAKIYKLEDGVKRWIKTAQAFNRLGYDWSKNAPVNQTEFDAYVTGMPIE